MTSPLPSRVPVRPAAATVALVLDALLVLLFVALGRQEHATADGLAGLLLTASPFLVGWAVMSLVTSAHRSWARLWPQGVVVWAGTVALGMLLRVWWGLGHAPASFVLVAAIVLGVFLLGRRLGARLLLRHRSTRVADKE